MQKNKKPLAQSSKSKPRPNKKVNKQRPGGYAENKKRVFMAWEWLMLPETHSPFCGVLFCVMILNSAITWHANFRNTFIHSVPG